MNASDMILKYIHAYKLSNVLFVADSLGLFDLMLTEKTVEELSKDTETNIDSLRITLNLLVYMGCVEKENKKYRLKQEYRDLLVRDTNTSMHDLIQLEAHLVKTHSSQECMKKSLLSIGEDFFNRSNKDGMAQTYGNAMDNGGKIAAIYVARAFGNVRSGKLLDIGGGPGTYSIQACKFYKGIHSTILDLPEMKEVADENIRKNQLEDRITFVPGSIVEDQISDKYDVVIISNLLHLFNADIRNAILAKAAACLNLNGKLILHDFFLNDDKTSPEVPVLFSLDWMLLGANFDTSKNDLAEYLSDKGFTDVQKVECNMIPTSIIVVTKSEEV